MKGKTSHLFGITVSTLLILIALCASLIFYMHTNTMDKARRIAQTDYQKENQRINDADITDENIIEDTNQNTDNVEVAEIETQTLEDMINYRMSLAENANVYSQNNENQNVNTDYSKGFSKNRYFYSQLDDNAKRIYDAIMNNQEKMKSGTATIKLDKNVSRVLQERDGQTLLTQEFQSAWDAISLDNPDLFYIDIAKVNLLIKKFSYVNRVEYELYIAPQTDSYLKSNFASKEEVDRALSEINYKMQTIIGSFTGSDYEKALKVHDYLINNMEYAADNYDSCYDIYGALINGRGVCEAYAEAYKYIMDELGIPCILVCGNATNDNQNTENHEWNYVELDGKWYAVDCTWDDPIVRGNGRLSEADKHKFFMKGAVVFDENHDAYGKLSSTGIEFLYTRLNYENYK